MPTPYLKKVKSPDTIKDDICFFGQTNFRNQMVKFGIKLDDRRRHMYVIGKTGMGKTTMMENMVLHDIYAGHGVGLVDPHGDFAEKIINYIPSSRINDVVYFNPADTDYPIGFNILEIKSEEQKHLVAAGLMAVFKKIWPDVWSSRMEYILNNTLLALLDYPGSTLLGINRLLSDKKYRQKVIRSVKDPVVKAFWQVEFASYNERYAQEAVAPIQNKIGQFLSASVIRNMVAQVKSTINIRNIMDNKKIFIMNLSKGRIGEDNSRLLGGMLITQIQLAAMERVDTPELERQDFFLYVDEFQNFATPSFVNILSEARKYRLSLIMAHQYVKQLDEVVADAVFGNVGTIVTFRIGGDDAEILEKEFSPTFLATDIVNLPKFQILLKLMINGVASQPFSAITMSPIGHPTESYDKVVRVSRERYGNKRENIEDKILRWSGLIEEETKEADETKTKEDFISHKKEKIIEPALSIPQTEEVVSLNDLLPTTATTISNEKKADQQKIIVQKPILTTNSQPSELAAIKKKKKKRKKKKKQDLTDIQINKESNIPVKKENKSVIDGPKKIKPDQIVNFNDFNKPINNDDDEDDAWRWNK
ncbi:MAG: type IV secretion system DNA-binding domain-containing protein [Candidatus Magasanikbacteria bacterium]|nr:type IV secretion system DNA-binding domain-containing protein [Candidatus Magasanikbacteria bacterium]